MPVIHCTVNGKPGYKYGQKGHCYTYARGNKQSQSSARAKAAAQGRAIKRSQNI